MPKVDGKSYPYTKEGYAAAAKAKKKKKKKKNPRAQAAANLASRIGKGR
jgi:hypothetical protein|tara:strand:+ start:2361 stop:2507 length:147 start_codon:yes stop_codon:yes gene_type:complete